MTPPEAGREPPADDRVEVIIDGRSLRVPRDMLVLDAAAAAGVHIPIYCAHPKMDPVAVCRMCLVHIEKMPKLQPACATRVSDGMTVVTESAEVAKVREGVLELLLINHPLDCPVCDRGGECDLQDFAFRYGPGASRFPITEKVHFDKAVPLSEHIELDQERCILCWRCTRYYEEITGEKELVLMQRGVRTLIAPFNGEPLRSPFQGNLPEICPVGALTHVQYRFRARPWDLQRTRGVCPECSYGCNLNVDTRDYEIRRFASRDNPLVDDMWLCDRGRYSATSWNDRLRVRRCTIRTAGGTETEVSVEEAVREAARRLHATVESHGSDALGVIASAEATNEELWLLQRLARDVLGTPNVDHRIGPLPDLDPAEHELGIAEIEDCDAVVVLGPEPEAAAPVLTLRLFKARTKGGVSVHRVVAAAEVRSLDRDLPAPGSIGLIADETNREHAALLAATLARDGRRIRRLTITRGVNGRGAKDMGMLPGLLPGYRPAPRTGLSGGEMLDAAAAGGIRALLLFGASASLAAPEVASRLEAALGRAETVVAIDTRPGPIAAAAGVLIPGHAYFEKAGTVTNVEGRVQRIRQALPPATSVPGETRVLTMLATELDADGWGGGDPLMVSREIAAELPAYRAAGNGGRALWGDPDR